MIAARTFGPLLRSMMVAGGNPITCYGPPAFPAGQDTADGEPVGPGSIAGDLPFGTRVVLGPPLNIVGHVNDRGGAVHGQHLDLWRPSCAHWPNPTVDVWRTQ